MEFVTNAIGRKVPVEVNGREKKPFKQASGFGDRADIRW